MQLQVFTYQDENPFEFTTVEIDGEAWFVAADVCKVLGISNVSDVLGSLESDEKLVSVIPRSGQKKAVNLINESGLYALIFRSKKQSAIQFRRWVTKVVLPAIRKTGSFDGIDRKATPNFVKRFNDNYLRVDEGYFSVISELFIILHGRLEQVGYIIPNKAYSGKEIRPDVSVGKLFYAYLKSNYPEHADKYKTYPHLFSNGLSFDAKQYPDSILHIFRKYVLSEWIPRHAHAYFSERDRKALDYLPKLLSGGKAA
ncbi:MAG: hypothetical protein JNM41_11255 [Flavipsychrobacter sp.]|nr:hypothetical protein [Flavipsychrobacter sp.]